MNPRIGLSVAGGILAASGLALAVAGPALATSSTTTATVTRAASSYTSPTIRSEAVEGFAVGDQVEAVCFVNATYVDGTDVWLRIAIADGGGWISRSVLDVPPLAPC